MSNQTMQKPSAKRRPRAGASGQTSGYRRQTARMEGRRDGTPLIFGWGGHLTRMQKQRIERRAAFSFFGVVIVAVLAVFVFGYIQQNYIIPSQPIVKVNGKGIPQDQYRKLLAYNAQETWNKVKGELKEQGALLPKLQAGDATASTQNQVLAQEIQADEANYAQSAITQTTVDNLIEDQLIQQGIKQFEQNDHVAASTLEPSASEIDARLTTFKAAFPVGETYANFLDKNRMSNDDVRSIIALKLRREKLQAYLSAKLVSPTRQVHLRRIETNTSADAQKVLDQITKDSSDATWSTLAKQSSLDVSTKNAGGDMGWVPPGTGDAAIEEWAYASARKVNDISGVLKDANGTYDVVQLLGVDPSRVVSTDLLDASRSNALAHWLGGQRYSTTNHVSTPDSTMMSASRNLPVTPDLNAQLPNMNPTPVSQGASLP